MLVIDGARGEGGGQVLRTSLGLSLVTGTPFRIDHIRANRRKPGLMRQHLTAVKAAQVIGGAAVEGAALGSQSLVFEPSGVHPGEHRFAVGTAGSATLVLQAVLPALLVAPKPSRLVLEGGTHNPMAPPFDFLARSFAPCLEAMGARLELELERPGFYPAGGGRFTAVVHPAPDGLRPLDLRERGAVVAHEARALVCNLANHIGQRELDRVAAELSWPPADLRLVRPPGSRGPGNALLLAVRSEHSCAVFSSFGARGVRAERVAELAIAEVRRYLAAGVPVEAHLADQLLIPLALAGSGRFRTLEPTLHTRTNIDSIREFLPAPIRAVEHARDDWEIVCGP